MHYPARIQTRFTISEMAADWHKLTIHSC